MDALSEGIRRMRAGNMVYGLYRVEPLAASRRVSTIVMPDRLLIAELSLHGQFKQVPEVLWFRRWYGRVFSLAGSAPASSRDAARCTPIVRGGLPTL